MSLDLASSRAWAQSDRLNYRTLTLWQTFNTHYSLTSLLFSRDGKTLAAGANGKVLLLDQGGTLTKTLSTKSEILKDDDPLRELAPQNEWVMALAFSPDGKTLAGAGSDGTVNLWGIDTGVLRVLDDPAVTGGFIENYDEPRKIKSHKGPVRAIAFSPDGTQLASGGDDKAVKLWDVVAGKLIRTLSGHVLKIGSLAFAEDGATIVSVATQQAGKTACEVKTWDTKSGELRLSYTIDTAEGNGPRDQRPSLAAAVNGDGRIVANHAESKQALSLWDALSAERVRDTGAGNGEQPNAITFTFDSLVAAAVGGQLMMYGGGHMTETGTVNLWAVRTGELLGTLGITRARTTYGGGRASLWLLCFSPDGRVLATSSGDGVVYVYAVP